MTHFVESQCAAPAMSDLPIEVHVKILAFLEYDTSDLSNFVIAAGETAGAAAIKESCKHLLGDEVFLRSALCSANDRRRDANLIKWLIGNDWRGDPTQMKQQIPLLAIRYKLFGS